MKNTDLLRQVWVEANDSKNVLITNLLTRYPFLKNNGNITRYYNIIYLNNEEKNIIGYYGSDEKTKRADFKSLLPTSIDYDVLLNLLSLYPLEDNLRTFIVDVSTIEYPEHIKRIVEKTRNKLIYTQQLKTLLLNYLPITHKEADMLVKDINKKKYSINLFEKVDTEMNLNLLDLIKQLMLPNQLVIEPNYYGARLIYNYLKL